MADQFLRCRAWTREHGEDRPDPLAIAARRQRRLLLASCRTDFGVSRRINFSYGEMFRVRMTFPLCDAFLIRAQRSKRAVRNARSSIPD